MKEGEGALFECAFCQVDDMKMYIAYRRDDNTGPEPGIVFFIIVPLAYNKSELRYTLLHLFLLIPKRNQ